MSETVWYEQIDKGLIELIKRIVKLRTVEGDLVSVPVFIRKPENDFIIDEYPCVTIYNLYTEFDKVRMDNRKVVVERDIPNNRLILEETSIPYSLYYQIDFWSKYQSEMNEMLMKWLGNVSRDFNLEVQDMSGNSRSCYMLLKDNMKKSDILDGTERLYHSMTTYRIYVEIDENVRLKEYMITRTEERTNIK